MNNKETPALKPVRVQKVILVFTPLNRDHCILEGINVLNLISPEKWYYIVSVFSLCLFKYWKVLGCDVRVMAYCLVYVSLSAKGVVYDVIAARGN
jgi:hypothetical protein